MTLSPFVPLLDNGVNSLDIWVDSTNGNDNNSGYIGSPLKTLGEVYRKFPVYQFSNGLQAGGFTIPATITINLMSNGPLRADYPALALLVGGGDAAVNQYRYRGPQMVRATDLATGPNVVVGGITPATVGRRTTLTFAPNPGWTVDNLRNHHLRITRGGVKVINEIPISQNTANVITLDLANGLSGLIQATDTIEICNAGARIISAASTQQILMAGMGQAGYMPCPIFWGNVDKSATFERIHITNFPLMAGVNGLTFDRCIIDNTPFMKGGNVAFVNCIFTLGWKLSGMSMEFPIDTRPDSAADPINQGQNLAVEFISTDLFICGNPDGAAQYIAKRNIGIYATSIALRGAIHVVGPGSFFWADDGGLSYYQVGLFGSGNAGPFIWCVHGAQARINTTAGATPFTVGTGTGNPLRVGVGAANPAIAYGTGVGAFEEVAGFNGNFHRAAAGGVAAPTGDLSRIFIAP